MVGIFRLPGLTAVTKAQARQENAVAVYIASSLLHSIPVTIQEINFHEIQEWSENNLFHQKMFRTQSINCFENFGKFVSYITLDSVVKMVNKASYAIYEKSSRPCQVVGDD